MYGGGCGRVVGSCGREDGCGQVWEGTKVLVEVCMLVKEKVCGGKGGTCKCKQQRSQPKPCGLCRGEVRWLWALQGKGMVVVGYRKA